MTIAMPAAPRVARERSEIPERYTWDLRPVYAREEAWEADLSGVPALAERAAAFEGRLDEGPAVLHEALEAYAALFRRLDRLGVFARRRADEDTRIGRHQGLVSRFEARRAEAAAATAFLRPELLALPEGRVEAYLAAEPGLADWEHWLRELLRDRPHVLPPGEERLLARLGEIGHAPMRIYGQLANADLDLGEIEDEAGDPTPLTLGSYLGYLRSPDRRLREAAYRGRLEGFAGLRNTCASALATQVRSHVLLAETRGFPSARAAALHPDHIPESVYDNLVASARAQLPLLHRFLALRAHALGLETLELWDLQTSLVPEAEVQVPYDEAVTLLLEALAPLGSDYVADARAGLREGRWVDVYETPGKRSGAYCGGGYDTPPYILLNYQPDLDGLFTLAHELGHAMHSYYANRAQPWSSHRYSMFAAEVASTANEALLAEHLLAKATDERVRAAVLAEQLGTLRGTFFRQVLLAELEAEAHARAEAGEALTADVFDEIGLRLNRDYYEPALRVDPMVAGEWAVIPHFYLDFYVFQYATGLAASTALVADILAEGEPAAGRYRDFLARGGGAHPIDALRAAGVDMRSPEPIEKAMGLYARRLDALSAILGADA